jgi:hypothetical protein
MSDMLDGCLADRREQRKKGERMKSERMRLKHNHSYVWIEIAEADGSLMYHKLLRIRDDVDKPLHREECT